MLTFKQFLAEGGNVKIGQHEANVVDVTPKTRQQVAGDIRDSLSDLHNKFYKQHKEHLFGKGARALSTGTAFSGSTSHLMDMAIPHDELVKHKKSFGDIDVKVDRQHLPKLQDMLQPGTSFGKYTVVGSKGSGGEHHVLVKHASGPTHQIDFEGTTYQNNEPSRFDQLSHSSHWDDVTSGFKGYHHKILLNAIGGDKHKFSIMYGLGNREGDASWETEPKNIATKLFGPKASEGDVQSFKSLVSGIQKYIPKNRHQNIVDKFRGDVAKKKDIDSSAAVSHLTKQLGILTEANDSSESHVSIVPLVGFSPFSHMGHQQDLGSALASLPGKKIVNISPKADLFSPEERSDILKRQWSDVPDLSVQSLKSAGDVIGQAFHGMPKGRRHLHMLVGHDRRAFAEGLKRNLEAGKIPEMKGQQFDSITIHHPEDTGRSHGMSGTNMRNAAASGDIDEFHRHLGPSFSRKEARTLMQRVKKGLASGKLAVKRKA